MLCSMLDLPEYLQMRTMIPNKNNPNSGRPKLPIPLTMEQDFKMRVIEIIYANIMIERKM